MFVEIIFETGSKSVAFYETEEEALSALEAHHSKAKNGEPGGPTGHPAERIKRVLTYDTHPADLNSSGLLPVEEVKNAVSATADDVSMGGQISNMELAAKIRELSDPHAQNAGKHESQYKMDETGEIAGSWSDE